MLLSEKVYHPSLRKIENLSEKACWIEAIMRWLKWEELKNICNAHHGVNITLSLLFAVTKLISPICSRLYGEDNCWFDTVGFIVNIFWGHQRSSQIKAPIIYIWKIQEKLSIFCFVQYVLNRCNFRENFSWKFRSLMRKNSKKYVYCSENMYITRGKRGKNNFYSYQESLNKNKGWNIFFSSMRRKKCYQNYSIWKLY
jgi:hypothetical protein